MRNPPSPQALFHQFLHGRCIVSTCMYALSSWHAHIILMRYTRIYSTRQCARSNLDMGYAYSLLQTARPLSLTQIALADNGTLPRLYSIINALFCTRLLSQCISATRCASIRCVLLQLYKEGSKETRPWAAAIKNSASHSSTEDTEGPAHEVCVCKRAWARKYESRKTARETERKSKKENKRGSDKEWRASTCMLVCTWPTPIISQSHLLCISGGSHYFVHTHTYKDGNCIYRPRMEKSHFDRPRTVDM